MDEHAAFSGQGQVGGGVLFERQKVGAAALRLLHRVRGGRGGALFVVGDPGLGKTSVLDRVCAQADPPLRIGSGRGDPMEEALPFSLVDQALDGLGGGRGLLEQGQAGARPVAGNATRHNEVLRWLRERATAPILLVFDDLHWADPESLSLISFICRRIATLPVGVIGALRPWPSAPIEMSSRLVHDGYARSERLAPLSEAAARELLTTRLGGPAGSDAIERACAVCAGNPLLLEQVALAIERGDQVPDQVGDSPSGVLSEFLLPRFAGLPESAMRVAQAASVFGAHFEPTLAAEATGLGEDDADRALDALWRSGLVRQESGNLLEFVHPLFAQALYDDLAPPVRRRLHRGAFRALARRGLETEAAEHAIRGHLDGDPDAVRALERTGVAALRAGALGAAIRYLQSAADMAGSLAGVKLLLATGQALLAAGESARAAGAYRNVLAREDLRPQERADALRMLGRTHFAMGDHDRASALFRDSATVAESVDPATAVDALLDEALAATPVKGPARSLPLAVRARELSRSSTVDVRRRAEVAWAFIASQVGDPSGLAAGVAAAKAVESDPLGRLSDLCWTWSILDTYGLVAMVAERYADAERVLTTALRVAKQAGAVEAVAALELNNGFLCYRMGRLDRAFAHVRQAASAVERVPVIESFVRVGEAVVLLHSGRVADSLACCADGESRAAQREEGLALLWLWHVRAQVHLREGRLAAACALYGQVEELAVRTGFRDPGMVPWARHAIAAYARNGRPDDALRLIEWLEGCALPSRWPRIAAHTGRAWLAERGGDADTATEHFEAATALHDEVCLPLEQAKTRLYYGSFLRRGGQPVRARRLLAVALRDAESMGAEWLTAHARAELSAAGGRRRRGTSSGGLTGQEQRVATLAGAGASNKEIAGALSLSVKTIEFHLQRVYAKLGIDSRRQLIAMTARGEIRQLRGAETAT